MATTLNYGWDKPTVGGANNTWGTSLNTDLDDIDADLKTVSDAADAAQTDATAAQTDATSALGATLAITPTVIVPGGTISNPTATIDLDVGGPVYRISATGILLGVNMLVTFTNRPPTEGKLVYLHVSCAGGGDIDTLIASGSKQWALPLSGDDVTSSGTQNLGNCASGSQAVYPIYIVAGV